MDVNDNFVRSLTDTCVYYCKTAKFQENVAETNPFFKLTLLKRIACQLGNLSCLVADNQVSCDILNESLKNYSDLADNKNGVNNYAESIQALARFFKNAQCQKWKSGLLDDTDQNRLPSFVVLNDTESCQNCKETEESSIKLLQEVCRNSDSVQLSSASNLNSEEKQGSNSEGYNSVLKSSTCFNQKRKNSSSIGGEPDFLKSRKLEETGDWSKYPKNDNSVVTAISRNVYASGVPESGNNSSKPVNRPLANFRTASAELRAQQLKKFGNGSKISENADDARQHQLKKSLGSRPRPVTSKFVIPVKSITKNEMYDDGGGGSGGSLGQQSDCQEEIDPRLEHIEPKMIEMIRSEIMDSSSAITWDDIAGLQFAKNTIQEIVVWPMLRPDIFTGLRRPPKGILLFGPPGTGKTLIAKCIASQSRSTFFSISASSLTSKWIGDGEKMVRALFAVARVDQPSVVFIDEIDSLLSKRSDTEHESSRRIKTEFLVQLDGATTGEEDRLLIIGATNRPQELDEAARRRLVKRLYIPLPEYQARIEMITRLMSKERNNLTTEQIQELADLTDGYSGADVKILCQEAALGPIRSISFSQIEHISTEQVRPVTMDDFKTALTRVRSSVSRDDLQCYIDWDKTYGSGSI